MYNVKGLAYCQFQNMMLKGILTIMNSKITLRVRKDGLQVLNLNPAQTRSINSAQSRDITKPKVATITYHSKRKSYTQMSRVRPK